MLEILQPRQLKMFTIQPFTEKVCHPYFQANASQIQMFVQITQDVFGKEGLGGPEILCRLHLPGDAAAAVLQISVSSLDPEKWSWEYETCKFSVPRQTYRIINAVDWTQQLVLYQALQVISEAHQGF